MGIFGVGRALEVALVWTNRPVFRLENKLESKLNLTLVNRRMFQK